MPSPLSGQEPVVLRLTGQGLDAPHITIRLNLGEGTVRNYQSSTISKTELATASKPPATPSPALGPNTPHTQFTSNSKYKKSTKYEDCHVF